MRYPQCKKALEPDTRICPSCKRIIVSSASSDSRYTDVLKPHSRVNIKGVGSRMTGQSRVSATRHTIATSDDSDTSHKIRCMKCNTVNDKGDRFCRNCKARLAS